MKPLLVYLHIPKAAGTAQRESLGRVYGKENVFWYGRDSSATEFDIDELGSSLAVGGHRALDFYPRSFKALYTSILRDPVQRAVSFFNYCSVLTNDGPATLAKEREKELAIWRRRGLDPSSMRRSIENCEEFRREINNFQCRYLSRNGATFKGVRQTLETENMVIGVVDQLQLLDEFLQSELEFPIIEYKRKINVGSSGYSSEILAEPGLAELIRSLNSEDQRLYDFVQFECGGLYARAVIASELKQRVPIMQRSDNLAEDSTSLNWKNVRIFSKGLLALSTEKPMLVTLVILNGTRESILFSAEDDSAYAIGWEFQDESGSYIDSIKGIARTEQAVLPGESKMVHFRFELDEDQLRGENPCNVEFSIVDNNKWMREENPFNSAWAALC